MFATDTARPRRTIARSIWLALGAIGLAGAGAALATSLLPERGAKIAMLVRQRLPKTPITAIDCGRVAGLCEITSGANLFYVDRGGRYLVIGRIYDMETRQDLTAARLLAINPDLLVGGAARANANADGDEQATAQPRPASAAPTAQRTLSLASLPQAGAIVWGNPAGRTVTVFTDFRCGYCRALATELRAMNVRVVERPISVLGSRSIADRVYCAHEPAKALRAAYEDKPFASSGRCDTAGLDANEGFARAQGLSGTPVIVRSDGAILEGYRPKAFLTRWLAEARS